MICVIFSEHYLFENVNHRKHFVLVSVNQNERFLCAKIVLSIKSAKYFMKKSHIANEINQMTCQDIDRRDFVLSSLIRTFELCS